MWRIACSTLMVIAVLGVLTGNAIAFGRMRPIPERLDVIHLADCVAPCWLGITPGVTTLDAAREQLDTIYSKQRGYTLSFEWVDPVLQERIEVARIGNLQRLFEVRIAYVSREPAPIVDRIYLDFGQKADYAPTVGELVALYGTPLMIDTTFKPMLMLYRDRQYTAAVNAPSNGIRLNDRIKWISLPGYFADSALQTEEERQFGLLSDEFRWRGFYSCWRAANRGEARCD